MATTTAYTLDQYKTDGEKALERKKEAAKAQADASYQKLLKYLPHGERAAAAGYSQGLSETARINAENSRLRAYAQAENDFADAHAELMNNYRLEKKAEQDAIYGEAKSMIEEQKWNTSTELYNYLYGEDGKGGVAAGLSDMQRQNINQLYKSYAENDTVKNSEANAAAEAAKTVEFGNGGLKFDKNIGATSWDEGDNIYIKDKNEKIYYVEIGGVVEDEKLYNKMAASGVADDVIFKYDGTFYFRHGSKIYIVQKRPSENDNWKEAFNISDSASDATTTTDNRSHQFGTRT